MIALVPMAYGDAFAFQAQALFLYDLLQERDPKINISHRELPPFHRHLTFLLSRPYAVQYVIELDGKMIGTVYLTKEGQGLLGDEIGIFLSKDYQGKGYGKEAVKRLMELNPRALYLANISPKNEESQAFFQKLGFRELQRVFVLEAG